MQIDIYLCNLIVNVYTSTSLLPDSKCKYIYLYNLIVNVYTSTSLLLESKCTSMYFSAT